MNILPISPKPWQERYVHDSLERFVVSDSEGSEVVSVRDTNPEVMASNAHLITSAPLLYDALRELLASIEDALFNEDIGCENERCEAAKQTAYHAIGVAEGRTRLKEGMPGTY